MSGGEHTALGFPNWTLDTLRLYLINILGDHPDAIDDDDDGIAAGVNLCQDNYSGIN